MRSRNEAHAHARHACALCFTHAHWAWNTWRGEFTEGFRYEATKSETPSTKKKESLINFTFVVAFLRHDILMQNM